MHIPSVFTNKSTVMQYLSLMKKWAFDMTSCYEAHFCFQIENLKKDFFLHKLPETSPLKNMYDMRMYTVTIKSSNLTWNF